MTAAEEVFESISQRLARDLSLRFGGVHVLFRRDEESWMVEVTEGGASWGSVSVWADEHDAFTEAQAEEFAAEVAFDVANNLWPDDATDPWPLCPVHRDHPLQTGVRRGRASLICLRDEAVAVPFGQLTNST